MHLLWRTLAISNCSAYVKSFNSSGIFPTQRPFARAKVGTFFFSRAPTHMGQTLLQSGAMIGPLNSLIGSELLHLAFLVTRVRHGYGNTRGDRVTGTHGYGYGIGIWHTAAYRVPVPRCHGYFTGIL